VLRGQKDRKNASARGFGKTKKKKKKNEVGGVGGKGAQNGAEKRKKGKG